MLELKKYLDQLISLNERDWKAFSQLFSETNLKKGDYFACVGRELVTSQNPYSSGAFQKLYLEGLEQYKNR